MYTLGGSSSLIPKLHSSTRQEGSAPFPLSIYELFLLQLTFSILRHKKPSTLQRSFPIPQVLNSRYTLAECIGRGKASSLPQTGTRSFRCDLWMPKKQSQTLVDSPRHSVGTGHRKVISTGNQSQDSTERRFCKSLVLLLLKENKITPHSQQCIFLSCTSRTNS